MTSGPVTIEMLTAALKEAKPPFRISRVMTSGGDVTSVLHEVGLGRLLDVVNTLVVQQQPNGKRVAAEVQDHIQRMYPEVWKVMHSTCRTSVRNYVAMASVVDRNKKVND